MAEHEPPHAAAGPRAAFADMPLVLKGITSFFVVFGAGSLLLPLWPGLEHRVAGAPLDRAAFFASGHGPFAMAFGAWLLLSAVGLLRRAAWGAWGAVLAYALLAAAEPRLAEQPRVGVQLALAWAWAAGTWVYLFRTARAAAFFGRAPQVRR